MRTYLFIYVLFQNIFFMFMSSGIIIKDSPRPPKCRLADDNGKCIECWYKDLLINGTCIPFPDGCHIADEKNNCLQCLAFRGLVNGECIFCSEGCIECGGNGKCTSCNYKYALSDGGCVKCSENCAKCSEDGTICYSCALGYSMYDGICFKRAEGCMKHMYGDSYEECYWKFGRCQGRFAECNDYGKCLFVAKGCHIQMLECHRKIKELNNNFEGAEADFIPICLECYSGYVLRDGLCLKCPKLCTTCHWSDGYKRIKCNRCITGYYMNELNVCTKCPTGCFRCDSDGECLRCSKGYWYSHSSKKCVKCTNNCASCGWRTGSCKRCQRGYELHERRCVPIKKNCFYGTPDGECVECHYGYGLKDGECIKCHR